MSDSSSKSRGAGRPGVARAALDALLATHAGDPIRRALWLDALDLRLRPYLPPSLAAHARLANVDGTKLVYIVDSPVWHARMRFAGPDLLVAAQSIGLPVVDVVVRTTSPSHRPATPVPRVPVGQPLVPASARPAFEAALASLRDTAEPSDTDRIRPPRASGKVPVDDPPAAGSGHPTGRIPPKG
jgi:hypothetical protein